MVGGKYHQNSLSWTFSLIFIPGIPVTLSLSLFSPLTEASRCCCGVSSVRCRHPEGEPSVGWTWLLSSLGQSRRSILHDGKMEPLRRQPCHVWGEEVSVVPEPLLRVPSNRRAHPPGPPGCSWAGEREEAAGDGYAARRWRCHVPLADVWSRSWKRGWPSQVGEGGDGKRDEDVLEAVAVRVCMQVHFSVTSHRVPTLFD